MMMKLIAAASLALSAAGQPGPEALGQQLAELRRFAQGEGERLWPGYGAAPFGFLLIGPQGETLLCRDAAPQGFTPAGRDAATGCARFTRPRSRLPEGLLAAMPLFGPPSTIVMGSPEATGHSRGEWLRTILHEHFHQWQGELPDYYARTAALDLAGGDRTGMWMINFAFPYDDPAAGAAYSAASRAHAAALDARGTRRFARAYDRYLAARRAFAAAVGERNWRYLELQLWQEGVARWTEIQLGRVYPDPEVRAAAAALEARTLDAIRQPDLARQRRELAYSFGAGEAMLLEACGRGWRRDYPGRLAIGPLLQDARAACGRGRIRRLSS